ncbi:hypothetical protein pqer_cds_711 [Pandoravirus quercus]|uniref:Uncharacterized protein n=1 Tax=Pandoravirus quercus TaxID=2107709 RepID=A0A2U7U9L4_9VIRU|nr:hypothetical protein pqer_cds_711 [Pandoravirus quercus]AVK75133.1 hypothetical protein pqer_cds_711 [Pandoravirus quercus]
MEAYDRGRALAGYVEDNESERYDSAPARGEGDGGTDLSTMLPGELWIDILRKAGLSAAGSAAQVSSVFLGYAQTAAQDIGAATKRGACRTPLACTRALVCAIVRDDPDDLAAILLSRVVDPQFPAVPTYASATDAELTRLFMSAGECTAVKSLAGDPVYFFEVPSATLPGGWTPLNMAVVFRSPRSIAVLKSFGARPTTTVEPLLAEAMRSADSPFVMVSTREDGTLAPLPPREVFRVDILTQLLRAFGRTSPLANTDTNPLTVAREGAVLESITKMMKPITRVDDPRVRFFLHPAGDVSALEPAPPSDDLSNQERIRIATDALATQWARVYARSWRGIINVLLDAGYSPDERTYIFPRVLDKIFDTRSMPERAVAVMALNDWVGAADEELDAYDAAGGTAAPDAVDRANRLQTRLIAVAVLRHIMGLYEAAPGSTPGTQSPM